MRKLIFLTIFLLFGLTACKQSDPPIVKPDIVTPNKNIIPACLAIDTDGDGLRDCEDPDIDNDGHQNQLPAIAINRLCYNQKTKYNCSNASNSTAQCVWTSTNNCVSAKSCGENIDSISCGTTQGCTWNNSANICDQSDWFPYDKTEWADTDHDGIGDNSDAFPLDPTEWADTLCKVHNNDPIWCKQLGDNLNFDDDWDGVPDYWDKFSSDPNNWQDTLCLVKNRDPKWCSIITDDVNFDWDHDGVPNLWDDLPKNNIGSFDIDGDGIPNELDVDIDGDGIPNELDAFPYDKTEWTDTDHDGLGNNVDFDQDNDGVPNLWDDFPIDIRYYYDSDGDGVPNQIDAFPYNPMEWKDTDGDGYGDNIDAFPNDPKEWKDTDGDGIGDNTDPDADADGHYNTLPLVGSEQMNLSCFKQLNEATCNSSSVINNSCKWTTQNRCVSSNSCGVHATQATCSSTLGCEWQGSTCENSDYFPLDKNEFKDAFHDGLGDDHEDFDIDHDGVPNLWDDFKSDPKAFVDSDNDGLYNIQLPVTASDFLRNTGTYYGQKIDFDNDNDGVPDLWDDLSNDAAEYFDINHNGIGNFMDPDLDGDNIPNNLDAFPYDKTEWSDTLCQVHNNDTKWCQQLGDNLNFDDDWDGVPDYWDSLPKNPNGFSDFNNDGIPDQLSIDLDGDKVLNGVAPRMLKDPANPLSGYITPFGITCGQDTNADGIPDTNIGYAINNFVCSYNTQTKVGTVYTTAYIDDGFIWDSTESIDSVCVSHSHQAAWCGIGDNSQFDDDWDGVPDYWDSLPNDSRGFSDINDNGLPDQIDPDLDGDNNPNNLESNTTVSPYGVFCGKDTNADGIPDTVSVNNFYCDYRNSFDDFPFDKGEWVDTDGDGLGDNIDFDQDNDGVPNYWDDLPLDKQYYWDNDHDGIPNELDIYTPNGITSEADIAIALAHNEDVIISSDINISNCINLPEGKRFLSTTSDFHIKYIGPANSCMINIVRGTPPTDGTVLNTTIGNLYFDLPAGIDGVKMITSSGGNLDELDISQSFIRISSKSIIADVYVRNQFRFVRNDVILKTSYDMPTNYQNMINVRSSSPAISDYLTAVLGGNILFWTIDHTQSSNISFMKLQNPMRKIIMSSNVLKMNASTGINLTGTASFLDGDFDYNLASTDITKRGSFEIALNRVNMSVGQMVKMISSNNSLTQLRTNAYSNQLYGVNTTGNNFANYNVSELIGVGCENLLDKPSCDGNLSCSWTGGTVTTGNYCSVNMSLAKPSFVNYFDFKDTDVFLKPEVNDYSMFYYPATDKILKSPAMFDAGTDNKDDLNVIQSTNLGSGYVYYVGCYPPARDSDGDGYRDELDAFPYDATEWRDSNKNGIGNNADPDDDSDNLLDIYEYSTCKQFDNEANCINSPVCKWDASKSACLRNPDVCSSFQTSATCSLVDVCGWDASTSTCNLNSSLKGCLVNGSSWNQSSMCCKNGSNQCVDGSDPYVQDSDGDGLSDYQEVQIYHTNPLLKDTDGDGESDYDEIANGTNPNDPMSSKDTDGDGLSDKYEKTNLIPLGCTNPQNFKDSDGDGISDYDEVMIYHTNPCKADSDGDGISDYDEIFTYHTNPLNTDSDGDGISDYDEIFTYHTNPLNIDSDGDGVPDGVEILTNHTDPLNPLSFLDTDGDGEPDYTDYTPYGVIPYPTCTNTNLAGCTGTFTNDQLLQEFQSQWTEVNACSGKSTQVSCESTTRKLCKWDTSTSVCKSKPLTLTKDIVFTNTSGFSSCLLIPSTSDITIRSAPNQRHSITIDNSMALNGTCIANAISVNSQTIYPFIFLSSLGTNAATLRLDNVKIITDTAMPTIISTKTSGAKNNQVYINNSELMSKNKNGASILYLLQPTTVNINKSTFRMDLDATTSPTITNMFNAVDIKNDGTVSSNISIKGSIFYCDLQNQLSSMWTNNRQFNCLKTQSDKLLFEGNVIYMEDNEGTLSDSNILSPTNYVYAINNETIGSGTLSSLKSSRIYSKSKTIKNSNLTTSLNPDVLNLGVINGSVSSPDTIDYTGFGATSFNVNLLPSFFTYNSLFISSTNLALKCAGNISTLDSEIDSGLIHPMYFKNFPVKDYFNLITLPIILRTIQTPGANNAITCP